MTICYIQIYVYTTVLIVQYLVRCVPRLLACPSLHGSHGSYAHTGGHLTYFDIQIH